MPRSIVTLIRTALCTRTRYHRPKGAGILYVLDGFTGVVI